MTYKRYQDYILIRSFPFLTYTFSAINFYTAFTVSQFNFDK